MPFRIVRNDITNMQVDAVVNTANHNPVVGYGVDTAIHKKAGPKLLEARKEIGPITVGEVAVTPGFDLDAKYVIHAVGPAWFGGSHSEPELLHRCYRNSLLAAFDRGCKSIAFPLLASGNMGFPKSVSLQIAISTFSSFLMTHEMDIYLVVFTNEAFELSANLVQSVESFIDENYVHDKTLEEFGLSPDDDFLDIRECQIRDRRLTRYRERMQEVCCAPAPSVMATPAAPPTALPNLDDVLKQMDAGFSETLLKLIDKTGKKDSEIYKRANVDRKLFSKIRKNPDYKPSKTTAIAFALALELNLEETKDFIGRAGFSFSPASKFDVIVQYFIQTGNYDVFEIDTVLFHYDLPLIGAE